MSTGRTPRDMALSLLVLIIPILLGVAAYRFLQGGDQPIERDPAPAIAQARTANRFPVATPTGLAAGWRPISAVYAETGGGGTLRIGYLTPGGAGVAVIQSSVPPDDLYPAELGADARPLGNESVDGRAWQRYAARDGETALVLRESGHSVIVNGRASSDELRALAASLR